MNTTFILAAQAAGQGSPMPMIIMMVAIFAIMWFFMIRPQQKKQKEIRAFQNALSAGDSVVTGGGIYGTVKHIDMTTIRLKLRLHVVLLSLLIRTTYLQTYRLLSRSD